MTGVKPDLIEHDIQTHSVDVECAPGDVVLFSNVLVHRGGINSTDKIRWSFDWRFQDVLQNTHRAESGHLVSTLTEQLNVCRSGEEWVTRSLS